MTLFFKTPLGNLVPWAGLNPGVSASTVNWGNGVTETLPTNVAAARYLALMQAALAALSSQAGGYVEDLSAQLWLLDVAPGTFNVKTTTVTVYGVGFTAANLGSGAWFRVEDGGPGNDGEDNNGLTMTPTYVNPVTFTAVFADVGDGDPFPSSGPSTAMLLLVYLTSAAAVQSNVLNGQSDTANNATMTYPP